MGLRTVFILLILSPTLRADGIVTINLPDRIISTLAADPKIQPEVRRYVIDELMDLTVDPTIISAIIKQNREKIPMERILRLDQAWKDAEDETPHIREVLHNACSKTLKSFVRRHAALMEVFVMDNQGANVGQNTLTQDFWQGDEPKWIESFNGGKGGVHTGSIRFDDSANQPLQQISVPIQHRGKVIGAICFGINVRMF